MRIVAVFLVSLLSMFNVYAVDSRSLDDLDMKNSKYIIFADKNEEAAEEEEPDCE